MSIDVTTAGPGLPPGLIPIAVVRPAVQSMIVAHTFLILLVPFLSALFYYSTPYTRRRPIFILNVLALVLAFSAGVIAEVIGVSHMFGSTHPDSEKLTVFVDVYLIQCFASRAVTVVGVLL